jgi:signal transduction histidine kinase
MAHELAASRREIAVLQWENATLKARLGARQVDGMSGDAARERLSQDLHDGVQQRLTALRIRVALAGQGFEARDDRTASMVLNDIGDEVDQAIDEVRAFAHGVYPAVWTQSGLRAALASVGRRSRGRVSIHVSGVGRYSSEIETAVYFSCLAALDNVAKHAGSAPATVRVWDHGDALHFTISDTGHGFDQLVMAPGAGITNMHDRIDAIGGGLTINSSSRGTVVAGCVPHPG